jgi:hypothetical protein
VNHTIYRPNIRQRLAHVGLDKSKIRISGQVGDITGTARKEVVHANHLVSLTQNQVAQVGRDKPSRTGNKKPHECSSEIIV